MSRANSISYHPKFLMHLPQNSRTYTHFTHDLAKSGVSLPNYSNSQSFSIKSSSSTHPLPSTSSSLTKVETTNPYTELQAKHKVPEMFRKQQDIASEGDQEPQLNLYRLWKGNLVKRDFSCPNNEPPLLSRKFFVGGIPRDMKEEHLMTIFRLFDPDVTLEWPEIKQNQLTPPKGYLYVIFSFIENVQKLLAYCQLEIDGGCETFVLKNGFGVSSRRPLQIIPWLHNDSVYNCGDLTDDQRLMLTVFIGALHGRLHARAVAHIFNEVFGNVLGVSIDTDRYNYPIGSGRVTFGNIDSYRKAVQAHYILIETEKFSKTVQIEPCIDDQMCSKCEVESAPNFCKEPQCFDYFCNSCWVSTHSSKNFRHTPVRRKCKYEY